MKPLRSALYLLVVVVIALFWQYSPISSDDDIQQDNTIRNDDVLEIDTFDQKIQQDTVLLNNSLRSRTIEDTIGWFFVPKNCEDKFRSLQVVLNSSHDSLQRIIFYGDSQIETDHLTGSFRDLAQTEFGGDGIGYLPRPDIYNTREGLSVHFEGFEYREMGGVEESLGGMWGREFHVVTEIPSIKIRPFQSQDSTYNLDVFYKGSCVLHVKNDGKVKSVHQLESGDEATLLRLTSPFMKETSILEFHDCSDLELYGLQLNQAKGVVVDHVPFRGARGLQTYRFDAQSMKSCFKQQQVPLIVLYFGVNIGIGEFDSYESYGKEVEKQIRLLQKSSPQSLIITIGCSDMAKISGGSIVSVQGIDRLVDVQKEVSLNNGALFWDLYGCMGGQASAIQWRKDGLINADYIHFSKSGAEYIAKELYRDLSILLEQSSVEDERPEDHQLKNEIL